MNADERECAAVIAGLLAQARGLAVPMRSITLLAALLLLLEPTRWMPPLSSGTHVCAALLLALGGLGEWLALRIAFDAALFARLATSTDPQALPRLDAALRSLALLPAAKAGRAIEPRAAGALRLLRALGVVLGLQFLLLVVGSLPGLASQVHP